MAKDSSKDTAVLDDEDSDDFATEIDSLGDRNSVDALADHIADATTELIEPDEHLDGTVITTALPPGWRVQARTVVSEQWRATPDRHRGTTKVNDGISFVRAVMDQQLDDTKELEDAYIPRLYADENSHQVTAVLNQSQGETLGWGDYRVELQLVRTPEWASWRDFQGLHPQVAFADFVEENLDNIAGPDAAYPLLLEPAELLDMAQYFSLTRNASFKRSEKLKDGQVQLTYEETGEASGGRSGNIVIPDEIHIVIKPFVGSELYRIKARFRYRMSEGKLAIGYKLINPDDVERNVFNDERARIAEGLEMPIVNGRLAPVAPHTA